MKTVVGVVRGKDKFASFDELLSMSGFDAALEKTCAESKKEKAVFSIAIKPNMMVFVNQKGFPAVVTDKDLVEYLVDRIRRMGFGRISVCEAQHDVGQMLKNHTVHFVAHHIGYDPRGRYAIVDLTRELRSFKYEYADASGNIKTWKDTVGATWRDADFRISFAKCKTHEHDWMTLSVKNIYGCFPATDKIKRYHITSEVWDVTSYAMRNFPLHFAFVDAWTCSDGFQGYKIPHPKPLNMLFGGENAVAVDMEIFKRAGLFDPDKATDAEKYRSKILSRTVDQLYGGVYPTYEVKGDAATRFADLGEWKNIDNIVVKNIDNWEEIYFSWGIFSLKMAADQVDYAMFPPKNLLFRISVIASKLLFKFLLLFPFYRNLYNLK